MRELCAVSASMEAMRSRSTSGARSRRPTNRTRTPCAFRSGSSRSIVSSKIRMRSSTSSEGRDQFSVENAYTVSDSMPRSIDASTMRRRTRVPARWPSATGTPRLSAQRPFPSMMIAIERGTSRLSMRAAGSAFSTTFTVEARSPTGELHLHDLGLFVFQELVDRVRVLLGQLLDALFGAALVVLSDLALTGKLFHMVDGIAADVPHGHAPVLRDLPDELHQLLAPLFRQLRYREPDDLAVVGGREPEVRLLDRLLDRLERVRVEGLDGQHPRLGDVDGRELPQRRLLAVVVDLDAVEERGRGSAGADTVELTFRRADGFVHPLLGILHQVVDHALPSFGVE